MEVLEWITAIILIVGLGMAGATKLMGHQMATEMAQKLGYTDRMRLIGGAEVLGAIGVLIGAISADIEWLGVLAAIGIIALLIGALIYHRRANDPPQQMIPAAVLIVVAVLYIIALFGN